jgi:hypothetical protein
LLPEAQRVGSKSRAENTIYLKVPDMAYFGRLKYRTKAEIITNIGPKYRTKAKNSY